MHTLRRSLAACRNRSTASAASKQTRQKHQISSSSSFVADPWMPHAHQLCAQADRALPGTPPTLPHQPSPQRTCSPTSATQALTAEGEPNVTISACRACLSTSGGTLVTPDCGARGRRNKGRGVIERERDLRMTGRPLLPPLYSPLLPLQSSSCLSTLPLSLGVSHRVVSAHARD